LNDKLELSRVLTDLKAGHRDLASTRLGVLVNNNAMLGDDWLVAARIAQNIGEVGLAKNALLRYVNINSHDSKRQLIRAGILAEMGQITEGLTLIETLKKAEVDNYSLQHFTASALLQLGDVYSALEQFRSLLSRWKGAGHSWYAFSALKTFSPDDVDFISLTNAADAVAKTDDISRACYQYALGKAYLDFAETAAAYRAFSAGAAIMKSRFKYDIRGERDIVDTIISSYRAKSFTELACSQLETIDPIFVLGWPRSGTTLVEQIISAHSQIIGGGEINLVHKATLPMKGSGCQYAKVFQDKFSSPQIAWEKTAMLYHHLVKERFGQNGKIVDKSLNNSRYLGLISRIFPKSPIIWLRRKPLDAAWSCYRTCFSGNMAWSWSLSDIAEHFANEDRLFQHWKNLLGDKILVVPYESLVSQPEVWERKIIHHCELPTENLLATFYSVERAVTTSSSIQVRQPIYQHSVSKTKDIESYLKDFNSRYHSLCTSLDLQ
jgi:hypothetical protein